MPVTKSPARNKSGATAATVAPAAPAAGPPSTAAAAAALPTDGHGGSSSSGSPSRHGSPNRPNRGEGVGLGGGSSNNSRIGLILSALAVLGLVTIGDLMVLPILTQEAAKASEAAMAPFRTDFSSGSSAQLTSSGSGGPSSSLSSSYSSAASASAMSGSGGLLHFPKPAYSSGAGSLSGGLGSPSSSSSPASTVTDPNGLTQASLHSSALLPSLDAQSPPLFPHDNETCLHGGVLTNLGCVCGRRTAGYRCETLLVPEEEAGEVGWCGPACWAGYVWYPTIHFKFAPLPPTETRWVEASKAFLAWTQGGVLRAVPQQQRNKAVVDKTDPVLMDWLTSLGPFTNEDKRMVEHWRRFRAEELESAKRRYEERLKDPRELAPKPDAGARICFALIVHKDPDQFEALWRVLYRPQHFYIIHVDKGSDPSLREAVRRTIDATPFTKPPPRHKPPKPAPPPPAPVVEASNGTVAADDAAASTNSSSGVVGDEKLTANEADATAAAAAAEAGGAASASTTTQIEEEWMPADSVWEHVELIDADDSVPALWGDVTLVYLEAVMWLRAFSHPEWANAFDYFINLSAADIPIVPIEHIEKHLGQRIPGSFMSYHANDQEFRQQHILPERQQEGEVVVLSHLQAEMPSGRWRVRHGQNRIYGCTQWHMWHWTMAYEFATNPEVHGLLLSMKDTGIPDEAFFATAAMWLIKTAEQRKAPTLSLAGGDLKYRNEGNQRDLRQPGEFEHLTHMSNAKSMLWARKAYTAFVTCDYTNKLLNLTHDCSKYEGAEPVKEVQRRRQRRLLRR